MSLVVLMRKNESKKIKQGILWNYIRLIVRNKDQASYQLNEELQT